MLNKNDYVPISRGAGYMPKTGLLAALVKRVNAAGREVFGIAYASKMGARSGVVRHRRTSR